MQALRLVWRGLASKLASKHWSAALLAHTKRRAAPRTCWPAFLICDAQQLDLWLDGVRLASLALGGILDDVQARRVWRWRTPRWDLLLEMGDDALLVWSSLGSFPAPLPYSLGMPLLAALDLHYGSRLVSHAKTIRTCQ
jgi:hypothetical protein